MAPFSRNLCSNHGAEARRVPAGQSKNKNGDPKAAIPYFAQAKRI
jgi:hypothetical protein